MTHSQLGEYCLHSDYLVQVRAEEGGAQEPWSSESEEQDQWVDEYEAVGFELEKIER